jgi:hypothetical protein
VRILHVTLKNTHETDLDLGATGPSVGDRFSVFGDVFRNNKRIGAGGYECVTLLFTPGPDPAGPPEAATDQCAATLSLPKARSRCRDWSTAPARYRSRWPSPAVPAPTAPPTASCRPRDQTNKEMSRSSSSSSSDRRRRITKGGACRASPFGMRSALLPSPNRTFGRALCRQRGVGRLELHVACLPRPRSEGCRRGDLRFERTSGDRSCPLLSVVCPSAADPARTDGSWPSLAYRLRPQHGSRLGRVRELEQPAPKTQSAVWGSKP